MYLKWNIIVKLFINNLCLKKKKVYVRYDFSGLWESINVMLGL